MAMVRSYDISPVSRASKMESTNMHVTQPEAAPKVVVTAEWAATAAASAVLMAKAEPGLKPYPVETIRD